MSASRALTGAIAVGAVAALSLFTAAPASAATLPDGQSITVIDGISWQFFDANPADAALTTVGSPSLTEDYVTGVDVNDEGIGYAITSDGYLFEADANTGTLSNGVEIRFDYIDVIEDTDGCSAIDYTDGVIYAACYLDAENFEATYVGPVNPDNGYLRPEIELSGDDYLNLTAIAVDPISGVLYGFEYDFGIELITGVYTLSEDEGATFVTLTENPVFGADFDRDGQLWVTSWVFGGDSESPEILSALATLDLTSGANPFIETMNVDGVDYEGSVEPITVWGVASEEAPPALAATGSTMAPAAAVIAAGVLLFGAVLAAGTVIARRRSLES